MAEEFYCALYLLKHPTSDDHVLLYGYAELHPSRQRPWHIESRGPLIIARAGLSKEDINEFTNQLINGKSFHLKTTDTNDKHPAIQGASRVRRPLIYRRPTMESQAFDASFGNRLCKVEEIWNLDKEYLTSALLQSLAGERDKILRLREISQIIADEVGEDFKGRTYEALGNFELYTVQPHLYQWRAINNEKSAALRTGISIELLHKRLPKGEKFFVEVSLENAAITTHSSIQEWIPDSPKSLTFQSEEPISWFEVKIFSSSGGLIDQSRDGFLTSIEIAGISLAGTKTINDAWSRKLERKFGKSKRSELEIVNRVETVGHVLRSIVTKQDPSEPWQRVSGQKPAIFESINQSGNTHFLPKEVVEDEIKRFDTMRSLFDDISVTRAILADPYFDKNSLPLLSRVRNKCMIEVITRKKDYEIAEVIDIIKNKPQLLSTSVKFHRATKDFHDRILIVERGEDREILILSNSFSPLLSTVPIIINKASGIDSLRILEYVDELLFSATEHAAEKVSLVSSERGSEPGATETAKVFDTSTSMLRVKLLELGQRSWEEINKFLRKLPSVEEVHLVLEYMGGYSNVVEHFGFPPTQNSIEARTAVLYTARHFISNIPIPYISRVGTGLSTDSWIEFLRSFCGQSTAAAAFIEIAINLISSSSLIYNHEYGFNLEIRLLAAWSPETFLQFIEIYLDQAVASLAQLAADRDPAASREIVSGALLLREITVALRHPAFAAALSKSNSKPLRRLVLASLISRESISSKNVYNYIHSGFDYFDISLAVLRQISANKESIHDELTDSLIFLLANIPSELQVRTILKRATIKTIWLVANKCQTRGTSLENICYSMLHDSFEATLLVYLSLHRDIDSDILEHLNFSSHAVHHLNSAGKLHISNHMRYLVQKILKQGVTFNRPRTRVLNYEFWLGYVRTIRLCSIYFIEVCRDLEFSKDDRITHIKLIDQLDLLLGEAIRPDEENASNRSSVLINPSELEAVRIGLSHLRLSLVAQPSE